MRIGIDFDNTIAGYDRVFLDLAVKTGLLPPGFVGGKRQIRDAIRRLDDGEAAWQRLQGQVYGKYMADAEMIDGADRFLAACRDRGVAVFVVSHKTEFGHMDPDRVNLRDAARRWMAARGLFAADGFAIPTGNVHFESTRAEKLRRIRALDCELFIDDLEEVLTDDGFPMGVRRILLARDGGRRAARPDAPFEAFADWDSIRGALFDA